MVDYSKFAFHSDFNYLKRDPDLVGSVDAPLGGFNTTTTVTVEHNLGVIPFVLVFSEIDDTDTIWSNGKVEETSFVEDDLTEILIEYEVDETALTIRLINITSPLATGNRMVYWVMYKDLTNA